jgi:hypothetical protein
MPDAATMLLAYQARLQYLRPLGRYFDSDIQDTARMCTALREVIDEDLPSVEIPNVETARRPAA